MSTVEEIQWSYIEGLSTVVAVTHMWSFTSQGSHDGITLLNLHTDTDGR